jgi:glycosyltransferase involved in cell wall biosynthesis
MMSEKLNRKTGIVGDALAPYFNEAYANQVRLLSQELNTPVLTCNNIGILPFRKMGRYLIINATFLRQEKPNPFLRLANGAFFYPFVKLFERKFDIVFLSAGISSGFLPFLDLRKCIPIINALSFSSDDEVARTFAHEFAPKIPAIIAQSRRVKERLVSMGVEPQKIHLIYPWVDAGEFNYSEPPGMEEFRILFASAPNVEREHEDLLAKKGLGLLLESFAEFSQQRKASLLLLWRGKYNEELYNRIRELGLESRVEVINEVVDTPPLFARAHITVTPFLTMSESPEIPLSAVESLASGRPVVTTDVPEISEIVEEYQCGCVARPKKEDFLSAMIECQENYAVYQGNCRKVSAELFHLNAERLIASMDFTG